jgi:hypothetical protein
MSSQKLSRSTYRDPTAGDALRTGDPNNPKDTLADKVDRAIESARDMEQFYIPSGQIHGSSMHGWGIASGLSVSVDPTTMESGLSVSPGVAIDRDGRHISLAEGAEADVSQNADMDGNPQSPHLTGVAATGAFVPTTENSVPLYNSGSYYLTIQFWEWFQGFIDPNTASSEFYKYLHTPWLRLLASVPAKGSPAEGSVIVLAEVTLDINGKVIALTRDAGRGVFLPAESIQLSRAVDTPGPDFAVDNQPSGEISSHPDGGIQLRGQVPGDGIHFVNSEGSESVTVYPDSGHLILGETGIFHILGENGIPGTISLTDGAGNYTVAASGGKAAISVGGGKGKPGLIQAKDEDYKITVEIQGEGGVANLKKLAAIDTESKAIDVDATSFQIHGSELILDGVSKKQNKALVDGGNKLIVNSGGDYKGGVEVQSNLAIDGVLSAGGVSLMGNPARKVMTGWLHAINGMVTSSSIPLPKPKSQCTAFISLQTINSRGGFAGSTVFVDIWQVDANPTPLEVLISPFFISSPYFSGQASSFIFRLFAGATDEATAYWVIFYE